MPAMHPARLLSLLAVVVTTAAFLRATPTTADDDQIVFSEFTCSPEGNYTDESPYAKNLTELLSVLATPAPATVDNWWFRSLTVGTAEHGNNNNNASGLAMCWADADAAACRSCLANLSPAISTSYLSPSCYHSRNVSFLSYNRCVIRYADAPFFGSANRSGGPRLVLRTREEARDTAGMREARGRLLTQLAEMAGGAALRFATGSQGFVDAVTGKTEVVYGLAQCTRDLPLSECTSCLLDYLAVMYSDVSVTNSTSASVMGVSCYLRYELNKPIDIAGLAQPPSPPPTAEHPAAGSSSAPPPLIAALTLAAGAIITVFNA